MFLSRNKKNNAYPCKPQFSCTKVGFKGINIIKACFRDVKITDVTDSICYGLIHLSMLLLYSAMIVHVWCSMYL